MYRCSKQQIYNMAQRHLALCREHDIIAEVDSFLLAMATRTSNNVPAAYAPVILPSRPTYVEAVPAAKANESPATVKKPHTHTESKWTPREEAILDDYLVKTKGCRKNWIYCSQLIGTRSVSQCKSKYNNEKLKRPKRQMLGI
ncbi:hypothetical protein H4S02_009736 [Coemansia sp. RSA 2611]|nr:hypothetical protein H4S01_004182 [Coemansia sp. RSA 2610]KAJ2370926.1 hypothetical protein H4S02_009736 [Coemansia sp. RSA 2611]